MPDDDPVIVDLKIEVDFSRVEDIKDDWIRFPGVPVLRDLPFGHIDTNAFQCFLAWLPFGASIGFPYVTDRNGCVLGHRTGH